MLNDQYWSERYEKSQTGWDLGGVSPALKDYFDQLTDKSLAILIPGCGNAYEALYLLENGFSNITLIDISEVLVRNLSVKLHDYIAVGKCRVIHQNFFEHAGQYDLIVEQTFFCAIDPSLRGEYVKKMPELLVPQGRLVGLLFDRAFEGGPPFGGSKEEYITLFDPYFTLKTIEKCYNSIPPRAGFEVFINFLSK
ncbi:thiopurine S-methyltransferase [Emticicia oligotrophica DSM 17448]|jgi:SAM-dependent methyltransferase|uniref:Thiopurine S-methyltransferase n=1 Tax=Emticicia oligotrophica (strain DSM 17448 / CIP 109782 / MTCC 6937 / GPTSA100-15) TaxID=929562 RepID=A0ABM5N2E4_EMTOG|nr:MULTISPECIES: methyltransferase domain-containing protein [Emticicia]AFK03531.1 thiopurine S-methyltransferase [Emticicia oligotrophica DSM 17448]